MPFTTETRLSCHRVQASSASHLPGRGKSCLVASRAGTFRRVRLLAALAVFAASVAAIPVSATAQAPEPLDPADCSNGTWVDDPESQPGLVADCTALVAIRNHFMSNPANAGVYWNTPWDKTRGRYGINGRFRVSTLDLHGLTGEIPAELLGKFTNLRGLTLSSSQLTGELAELLGKFTNLRGLTLSGSQLTGEIPAELLGKLTNLESLTLSGSQLTGEIPAELGKLTNLRGLALSGSQITGEIPAELGKLTNLRGLILSGNQITGEIPAELGKLTKLERLDLSGNRLTGEIPAELLGKLTNLQRLDLYDNQLTGAIPAELGKLTNLQSLNLYDNQLTGAIPAELGKLTNLQRLDLYDNQLTGTIPAELGKLTNLQHLWLHFNQLTGEIPAELGKLTNLTAEGFTFCPNRLTGAMLSQLRALVDLNTGYWDYRRAWISTIPEDVGWPQGQVDLDNLASFCRLEVTAPAFEGRFSDDEGSVHEDSIEQIAQWGITTGCEENRFCPQRTVNRSQMSAFLYRAVTHLHRAPDPGGEVRLSDVADDAWYRTNAQWAVNNGVMRAPGGSFNPRGAVTRADMAEMLVAAFDHISAPARAQGLFSDTAGFSDAAVRAMEGIRAAGVTAGCATNPLRYCPSETVTRAQMASFLTRAIQAADAGT